MFLTAGMIATALLVIASAKYREAVVNATVVYTAEAYSETAKNLEEQLVEIAEPKTILVEVEWSKETIKDEVWRAAAKYNTFPDKMWKVMLCENKDLNPTLQSFHTYKYSDPTRGIIAGEREKSFGLAQIHLPDHPSISYEQATNPEFAIDFMAKNFAEGNARWWSCYKMIY